MKIILMLLLGLFTHAAFAWGKLPQQKCEALAHDVFADKGIDHRFVVPCSKISTMIQFRCVKEAYRSVENLYAFEMINFINLCPMIDTEAEKKCLDKKFDKYQLYGDAGNAAKIIRSCARL